MGVHKEFLRIIESYMHGSNYSFPSDFENIEELYKLSAEQKMTAAVYEVIRRSNVANMQTFRNASIIEVFTQARKTEGFLELYRKLRAKGVRPLVVKGIIMRELYEKPDHRVSADEDVLLREEDFPIWEEILSEEGFICMVEIEEGKELPYEIPYRNPKTGVYVELHFSLFAEEAGAYGHLNKEFKDVFDTAVDVQIKDVLVGTLNPTMHLFYLLCHSLKHFLHSGFGVRQVCDMVMFSECYGKEIDWEFLEERLTVLRMKEFFCAIVDIGRRYLGFDVEKACVPTQMLIYDTDCRNLLYDMLSGGIYGGNTMERRNSANITLTAKKKGKDSIVSGMVQSLFPSADYMKKRYPKLMSYQVFLPVAWAVRMMEYVVRFGKEERDVTASLEIGRKRVELLKQYHLID